MKFQKPTHESLQSKRPISEVLLEFARPLLGEKPDRERLDAVMIHAIMLWNMALFSEADQKRYWKMIEEQLRKGLPFQIVPGYLQELRSMFRRRQELYPDDRRAVSHHEIKWVNGEPRLKVYFQAGKPQHYAS